MGANTSTVLVVDDEDDVRESTAAILRREGFVVLDALEESSTVVVFSGFGDFQEPEIRQRFGAVVFDCLRKPVPPPYLVEVVAAAAAHARDQGHEAEVRSIAPRMALRLATAGLARPTPQTERDDRTPTPGGEARPTH